MFLQNWCKDGRTTTLVQHRFYRKIKASRHREAASTGKKGFHGLYVAVICDK
ncbi:hypothetical protein AGABI2DRAFT_194980 [Agaricus bisporus var. bisporus H97]|uniref:hypothetical protein n=1 Tax=Agaricus bisporus var. bisporus (strain H97 / ATCC MYA-4626 / FGSC 10389) TaxID=936046 RepID=UPI00029F5416|nr:hypothetical protein AGABI2DRAFT_194980 [Agaricus bisporus var. bisporus H97]EKV44182.1 hypothetical protein AGABI2DRAFT_194980 [Agaricus bisporus var. bisporus H97]